MMYVFLSDHDVGEILAKHVVAQHPSMADLNWTLEFRQDGFFVKFDTAATVNSVIRMANPLAAQIVMHAIEQSSALEKRAVDNAYQIGQQLNDKVKEELQFL